MPPKRKNPTKTEDGEVKAGSHVYVLTRELDDRKYGRKAEVDLIGIYTSKNAAVASAGDVDTDGYGTFDEAINEDFKDCHEDFRDEAPDEGLLLEVGNRDHGGGFNVQLLINKTEVLGMPEPTKKRAQPKQKQFVTTSDYFGY